MKSKICNKILVVLVLATFFVPLFSSAMIVPMANVTVVVNTQGADTSFHFNLENVQEFDLQTNNLSAQTTIYILGPDGSYSLSQDNVPGLKVDNIFCTSDNPNNAFWYQSNSVKFSPVFGENITCTFNNVIAQTKTPVLIVPGLLGTEMFSGSEKLWADSTRMILDMGDDFMDPLKFNEELLPTDNSVVPEKVISREVIFDYSEGLINEFVGQEYIEGETLFTFPYDWRYGVSGKYEAGATNVDLLKNKINEILQQTGADKVDVVAHSMGGLIVKKYAMDNPQDNHIGKAVFVGVPNTGAPKSVKVLLQGDNFGVLGLNDQEMKKLAENMPSAYDLLPSQQYYNTKGSYIQTIDKTKCSGNSSIPCEVKDLNYQETKSFLNNMGFNSIAITNGTNLHTQAFDNFDIRTTGVELYAINGCKTATLSKIIQTKYNDIFGQQFSYRRQVSPGDKTVPLESATNLPIDQQNKYYALVADHGKMPSQNGIRQQIVNLISGSNLAIGSMYGESLITQDIAKCQLDGKAISVFSPVDIFVTDQQGNKLGLAEDGSIINEIPNANFEIWGESANSADRHKFIYLPTDAGQTYTTSLQATGSGTYTIEVDNIQNNQTIKTETFSNLPVTSTLTGNVNFPTSTEPQTTLTVKQLPTSLAMIIYPDSETPEDTTPPEAIIEFDPVAKDLKFTGKDNVSPANEITITDKDDTITLADKAGNTTEIKLKGKNRKITMKVEIKSIKYNGKIAETSKNKMAFLWLYGKKGNLKMLSQYVASKKDYNILALYKGKNTTLIGKDQTGRIFKTIKGLKILKITTDNGELKWSY